MPSRQCPNTSAHYYPDEVDVFLAFYARFGDGRVCWLTRTARGLGQNSRPIGQGPARRSLSPATTMHIASTSVGVVET